MVQAGQRCGKLLFRAEDLNGALQATDVGERWHNEMIDGDSIELAGIGLDVVVVPL